MDTPTYTRTAIALHWLVALILVGTFAVGLYMHDLPLSPWKLKVFSWHKWAGVTLFLLAVVRLAWRLGHRPPPPPANQPAWQQFAAESTHHLLYVLMLAIPITGWLMSSAKGFQTVYFGVLPLPDLVGKDPQLGDLLQAVHKYLNFVFAGLVLGHTAAALKHHWLDQDGVLTRMLPFLAKTH